MGSRDGQKCSYAHGSIWLVSNGAVQHHDHKFLVAGSIRDRFVEQMRASPRIADHDQGNSALKSVSCPYRGAWTKPRPVSKMSHPTNRSRVVLAMR